jgi:hypothetical protein
MNDFDPQYVDNILKNKEGDIKEFCSPFSGNCFEIALALYKIFTPHVDGFCSVYAHKNYIASPEALPMHITVQLDGELFDAGGHLYRSHLLEEYAHEQNPDLIVFEDVFQYDDVIVVNKLHRIIEEYNNSFQCQSD